MGLSPSEFWAMTLEELYLAIDGFAEFHSGGKARPLDRDELEDLMERYPDQ